MTKKKKKKKSSFLLLTFSISLLSLSLLFFGTSTVLLKAYDTGLIEEKQELEAEIKELNQLNEMLYKEILVIDTTNQTNMKDFSSKLDLQHIQENIIEIDAENE